MSENQTCGLILLERFGFFFILIKYFGIVVWCHLKMRVESRKHLKKINILIHISELIDCAELTKCRSFSVTYCLNFFCTNCTSRFTDYIISL